jgi:hypothetical protein
MRKRVRLNTGPGFEMVTIISKTYVIANKACLEHSNAFDIYGRWKNEWIAHPLALCNGMLLPGSTSTEMARGSIAGSNDTDQYCSIAARHWFMMLRG